MRLFETGGDVERMSNLGISQTQASRRDERTKSALIVNNSGLYWPSGMVRAMQYEPFFRSSPEWEATFSTRHSEFLTRLTLDRRLPVRIARRMFRRHLARYTTLWEEQQEDKLVAEAENHDIVSIIKSHGIRLYERILELKRPRVIMDINDAVWLPHFYWNDLTETLSMVHGVICENEYIADYARRFNSRVFVVPDSPQVEIFDRFRGSVHRDPRRVTLGWIGGYQNLGALIGILDALEPLFARYPQLHLRVVGARSSMLPKRKYLRYSCRSKFSQSDMVREVLAFDIGLFPLLHNDDGRARGTLKALVYMSGEVAVVGENFGENPGLIQEGINGVLVSSLNEWHDKVENLVLDAGQRLALAKGGLDTVRQKYTGAHIFGRIVDAYNCVCVSASG